MDRNHSNVTDTANLSPYAYHVGPEVAAVPVVIAPEETRYRRTPPLVSALASRLDEIAAFKRGWNGYSAPPPSPEAVASARLALAVLQEHEISPSRIVPDASGGIAFYFIAYGGRLTTLGFSNDGVTRLSRRDAANFGVPVVVDPASLEDYFDEFQNP